MPQRFIPTWIIAQKVERHILGSKNCSLTQAVNLVQHFFHSRTDRWLLLGNKPNVVAIRRRAT
jgi:hypothetical protein